VPVTFRNLIVLWMRGYPDQDGFAQGDSAVASRFLLDVYMSPQDVTPAHVLEYRKARTAAVLDQKALDPRGSTRKVADINLDARENTFLPCLFDMCAPGYKATKAQERAPYSVMETYWDFAPSEKVIWCTSLS